MDKATHYGKVGGFTIELGISGRKFHFFSAEQCVGCGEDLQQNAKLCKDTFGHELVCSCSQRVVLHPYSKK